MDEQEEIKIIDIQPLEETTPIEPPPSNLEAEINSIEEQPAENNTEMKPKKVKRPPSEAKLKSLERARQSKYKKEKERKEKLKDYDKLLQKTARYEDQISLYESLLKKHVEQPHPKPQPQREQQQQPPQPRRRVDFSSLF
jgi:flagellar motility protein MotE (MotC chaperone)